MPGGITSPVRLHPGIANSWARRIAELRHFLEQEDTRTEATEIIRSLIERVTVHQRQDGTTEIELEGELTRMLEVSLDAEGVSKHKKTTLADAERRSVLVVAGAGFEPAAFRL